MLTPRQAYVLERLYVGHGWSALKIATALGLGRRVVENALRRAGVEVSAKKRATLAPALSNEAARAWFAAAERPEVAELYDPAPPLKLVDGATTFRRRRCQACGQLTTYAVACPRCHAPLDIEEKRDG